ncbi:cadmium-translocating P-type ATPase [Luteolibacter yonseiensis]|uniref:Cadmium-translocating P-type ATPase n=1 Tax=Luteolibacter yonseiensis TaxID=1144680 RepID=A0A934VBK6_9BACT|nr:heavy metal translocating P-type ATPase [Luteolibacter yonseiensis]MBK1817373.1 cadmium-translocating P-type ATPase [Luteolibacter yonseiensis]
MSEHDHQDHKQEPVKKTGCSSCEHSHDESPLPQGALVVASGVLTGIGLLLNWLHVAPGWLATVAFAAATLAGGLLVFPAAWGALKKFKLDINVLMAVAVTGAWIIGEGAEAASVVFLFSLSELLESWASGRARKAVDSLLKLSPPTALVKNADGTEQEIPVADVAVDREILIRSGSRIPLDGEVVSGNSSVNQAPITGESLPVEKKAGDPVYAGTVNAEGSLTVRVTKPAAESTLARIIQLVGEAEENKPPTQRFVDRFAAIYTPAVFVVAILVALIPPLFFQQPWQFWIYRSLVLLVISCPCALVIATPVSIVSGLTALARRGVLVKGGVHLESVGKLRALAVDKTGTITQGKPQVVEIIPIGELSEEEVLRSSAAINTHSEHPLAFAIVETARSRNIEFAPAADYVSVTGQGAQATVDGHPYFIGNHRMAHEAGVCTPEVEKILATIEAKGQSLAVLGHLPHGECRGRILGIIAIADTLRPEVVEALRQIHKAGIQKVIMLSGDNQRTASAIAKQAGIDEAIGDLMPDQKVDHVRKLVSQYTHVGMIGDGVNDAPALAVATVGFAMGAIGSDTAIETADIALMKDDLTRVAETVILGRRTLGIIRFNVIFALAIKAVVLTLAFVGIAGLWLAILADTGATLLVILNSLRLLAAPKKP